MIVLIVGLVGSGKTACMVREMLADQSGRKYFSNIKTRNGINNNIFIKPEMILKKEPILNNDGKPSISKGQPVMKYSVNKEFWQNASSKYGSLNVVIDEAHVILNARRGMTKSAQAVLDWISLLRRVLGQADSGYGRLFLVTQIERRLDVVAKEQSTEVRFHMCHYEKRCLKCGFCMKENNETPDPVYMCPRCKNGLNKMNHVIEVWHFSQYTHFINWKYLGKGNNYYKHYLITDIEKVFPFYNTMQWDNLLTDL